MDLRQLAKAAAGKLHLLTEDEKRILLQEIEELEREDAKNLAQNDFMTFVRRMWPGFIPGRHHEIVAKAFENVVNGHNKRLIINMAPRHTKSEFASYLLPAWFLGKNPNKKIIQTSHTAELAVGFGRKVRNLIDSEEYNQVFNDVKLKADNKSAGRWATNKGGEYFSIGVGGSVTGKGADLLIIDDPHSEQEAKLAAHKPDIFDSVYEWYTSGPRQRLQPGGAIIIVATRWSLRDLTGQVIKASQTRGGDEWEVIELPAIMPSGKPVWPEFWKLEECKIAASELKNKGITTTIIDARFAKPLDKELILKSANTHEVLITIEEGSIGGFGSHVANLLAENGIFDKGLKFRSMILPDVFIDQDTPEKMYDVAGLNAKHISQKVLEVFFSKDGIRVIK